MPHAQEDAESEESVEEEELIELVDREQEVLQVFSRKRLMLYIEMVSRTSISLR